MLFRLVDRERDDSEFVMRRVDNKVGRQIQIYRELLLTCPETETDRALLTRLSSIVKWLRFTTPESKYCKLESPSAIKACRASLSRDIVEVKRSYVILPNSFFICSCAMSPMLSSMLSSFFASKDANRRRDMDNRRLESFSGEPESLSSDSVPNVAKDFLRIGTFDGESSAPGLLGTTPSGIGVEFLGSRTLIFKKSS